MVDERRVQVRTKCKGNELTQQIRWNDMAKLKQV